MADKNYPSTFTMTPGQTFTNTTGAKTSSEIIKILQAKYDEAIANGDVEAIAAIGDNLYNYDTLAANVNPSITNTAIDNMRLIEKGKYEAAKNYELKNGVPYFPKNEKEVVITPEEFDAIVKAKQNDGAGMQQINDAFNKIKQDNKNTIDAVKADEFFAETTDAKGNKVYIAKPYLSEWKSGKTVDKEGNPIKLYSQQEYAKAELIRRKELGISDKKSVKEKTAEGWSVGGTLYKTEAEADAALSSTTSKEDELKKLAGDVGVDTGVVGEEINQTITAEDAKTKQDLLDFVNKNGLDLDPTTLDKYVKEINDGTKTPEGIKQFYRDTQLKSQYPAWADKIDSGWDVTDFASPYIKKLASVLELGDASSYGDPTLASQLLNDNLVQQALSGVDANGKPSYMPLWQFEEKLKQDDRYFQTNKSHNDMASLAASIGQTFGMI